MRRRQKCTQCGNDCDPEVVKYRKQRNWSILCSECHRKERAAVHMKELASRAQELRKLFGDRRCVVCGSPIQWKDSYLRKTPDRWPLTCCNSCHGKYSKRDRVLDASEIEQRLTTAINELGEASYKDVIHKAHIASKVLVKNHICVSGLMKKVLGISTNRVDYTCARVDNGMTKLDLMHKYQINGDIKELAHSVIHDRKYTLDQAAAVITDCIRCLVTEADAYVGVVQVMKQLGIAHETLVDKYKIDVVKINRDLGYINKRQSWFEEMTYKMLCDAFGKANISREHSFSDCRSAKGFPLRYDFYIPSITTIIEVDGNQHNNRSNKFYTEIGVDNDCIKNDYAVSHHYKIYRIATDPAKTFLDRVHDLLGVLKPVELLETRTCEDEGNQQPSLHKPVQEGSETIERQLWLDLVE